MKPAYEIAIYQELGADIAKQLNDLNCDIVIDVATLTYKFSNCPEFLSDKIMALKVSKGECSILNEYIPEAILKTLYDHL